MQLALETAFQAHAQPLHGLALLRVDVLILGPPDLGVPALRFAVRAAASLVEGAMVSRLPTPDALQQSLLLQEVAQGAAAPTLGPWDHGTLAPPSAQGAAV